MTTIPLPTLTTGGASLRSSHQAALGLPADGSQITSWLDQSGNGYSRSGHGTVKPVVRATGWSGGRPAVQFTRASGSYLQESLPADAAFLSNGGGWTRFLVFAPTVPRASFLYPSDSRFTLMDTGGSVDSQVGISLSSYDAATGNVGADLSVARGVATAPPAVVQSTTVGLAHSTSATSGAFGSSVSAGNTLVALIWCQDSAAGLSSVTDNKGNTYVLDKKQTGASPYINCEIWRASSATGAFTGGSGVAITAHAAGTTYLAVCACEVSGVVVVSPIDPNAGASSGASASVLSGSHTFSAGPIATSNANDLIITTFATGDASVITAPTGYTIIRSQVAGISEDGGAAYKVVSATVSAEDPVWTVTFGSANFWSAATIAYRASGYAINTSALSPTVLPSDPHCWIIRCDGSNYSITDWDGAVVLASTPIDRPFSSADPTRPLTIGYNLDSSSHGSDMLVAEDTIFHGDLNTTDTNAMIARLEALYHVAGNPSAEQLLGPVAFAVSGSTVVGANPLTRHGTAPVFERTGTGSRYDQNKNYFSVILIDGVYYLWVNCFNSDATVVGTEYVISPDMVTFFKPDLYQVAYLGSTANNLLFGVSAQFNDVVYNASGATGKKFVGANSNQPDIYLSEDGIVWTAPGIISLDPSVYREGKSLARRSDGRYVYYYRLGVTNNRSIGQLVSDTSDPAGTWTDEGTHPAFVSPATTAQYYDIKVNVLSSSYWVASLTRYNASTQIASLDMYVSRDGGGSWTQQQSGWLVPVSGWDGKGCYFANLVSVGSNWQAWYQGTNQLHDSGAPYEYQLGYATVPQGRLARISGTGTFTSRAIYFPTGALTINADASGGGSVTAALLDAQGNVISGYGDAQSNTISTDTTAGAFTWNGLYLPAQTLRVRLTLAGGAKVYGLSVGPQAVAPVQIAIGTGSRSVTVSGGGRG